MLIVTTENIPGIQYDVLGLVQGSTIQSKHIGHDISQSFKTIVGGELKAYSQMMEEARAIATERLIKNAAALGANAIVSVRYATSSVMQNAAEVLAYGTAVRFK